MKRGLLILFFLVSIIFLIAGVLAITDCDMLSPLTFVVPEDWGGPKLQFYANCYSSQYYSFCPLCMKDVETGPELTLAEMSEEFLQKYKSAYMQTYNVGLEAAPQSGYHAYVPDDLCTSNPWITGKGWKCFYEDWSSVDMVTTGLECYYDVELNIEMCNPLKSCPVDSEGHISTWRPSYWECGCPYACIPGWINFGCIGSDVNTEALSHCQLVEVIPEIPPGVLVEKQGFSVEGTFSESNAFASCASHCADIRMSQPKYKVVCEEGTVQRDICDAVTEEVGAGAGAGAGSEIDVEICDGEDNNHNGLKDETNCRNIEEGEPDYCLNPGECPLGYVCGRPRSFITGGAGETGSCQICKSVCKVCPLHPPEATKKNPLGICASEKNGGYPFSKDCIDYLNKISCMTCEDKDQDIPGAETPKARENDGRAGTNQNGDPIWSGTSFERGTGKVIKDSSSNALFPKYNREGGNNKDVLFQDNPLDYNDNGDMVRVGDIIDCALFAPIHYEPKKPLQDEKNAWFGVCQGMMCINPECTSDCGKGRSYEKWVDKKGSKIEPKGPYVEKLTEMCPQDSHYYNKKKGYGYTNKKKDGSWGNLFNDVKVNKIPPNCYVDDLGDSEKCSYLVDEGGVHKVDDNQRTTINKNKQICLNLHRKKAYYYIYLDTFYNIYCKCIKATVEFETQFAFLDSPNYEKYYTTTAALGHPIDSYMKDPSEDNLFRLLNAVKEWVSFG